MTGRGDEVDALQAFLESEMPEFEPAPLSERRHVLDEILESWLRRLRGDLIRLTEGGFRSHAAPVRVRAGSVDPQASAPLTVVRAAPRDASCCLDERSAGTFEYWILISRSLVQDLYFLFSALDLGPSDLLVQGPNGSSGMRDVLAPDFVASRDAEEPLRCTSVALEFIALHELSHAMRGHIPYLQQRQLLGRSMLCEIGAMSYTGRPATQLHQAIELDADLSALGMQLHFASRGKRPLSVVADCSSEEYASRLGYVLGVIFRVFELWRRQARGPRHDPLDATHPHPDIRQVIVDAWIRQRIKEQGDVDAQLCEQVLKHADRGREAIERLGPSFLPDLTYMQQKGRDAVLQELEDVKATLYDEVRPSLLEFVASR